MSAQNKKQFDQLITARLGPILKAEGFKKNRLNWKRLGDPLINCIELQTKSDNTGCCVNLGVHFSFLPARGRDVSGPADFAKIRAASCEIDDRLTWEGESDHWWRYDDPESQANDLVECYLDRGRQYFERFAEFPRPFVDISGDVLNSKERNEIFR